MEKFEYNDSNHSIIERTTNENINNNNTDLQTQEFSVVDDADVETKKHIPDDMVLAQLTLNIELDLNQNHPLLQDYQARNKYIVDNIIDKLNTINMPFFSSTSAQNKAKLCPVTEDKPNENTSNEVKREIDCNLKRQTNYALTNEPKNYFLPCDMNLDLDKPEEYKMMHQDQGNIIREHFNDYAVESIYEETDSEAHETKFKNHGESAPTDKKIHKKLQHKNSFEEADRLQEANIIREELGDRSHKVATGSDVSSHNNSKVTILEFNCSQMNEPFEKHEPSFGLIDDKNEKRYVIQKTSMISKLTPHKESPCENCRINQTVSDPKKTIFDDESNLDGKKVKKMQPKSGFRRHEENEKKPESTDDFMNESLAENTESVFRNEGSCVNSRVIKREKRPDTSFVKKQQDNNDKKQPNEADDFPKSEIINHNRINFSNAGQVNSRFNKNYESLWTTENKTREGTQPKVYEKQEPFNFVNEATNYGNSESESVDSFDPRIQKLQRNTKLNPIDNYKCNDVKREKGFESNSVEPIEINYNIGKFFDKNKRIQESIKLEKDDKLWYKQTEHKVDGKKQNLSVGVIREENNENSDTEILIRCCKLGSKSEVGSQFSEQSVLEINHKRQNVDATLKLPKVQGKGELKIVALENPPLEITFGASRAENQQTRRRS